MRHEVTECGHCGVIYSYQSSGYGCHGKLNHDMHCPDCMQVQIDALKKVPVKFEYRRVETSELTKEEALDIIKHEEYIENEKRKRIESNGGIHGRRVFPSLFTIGTGESSTEKRFTHNMLKFHISYWKSRPDDYTITKEIRWNLETNEEENSYPSGRKEQSQ